LKHRIIFSIALLMLLMVAPAAFAAPPGASASDYESVSAEFDIGAGFLNVSADNFTESYEEGSFEGSNAFVSYFSETETGFVECFAFAEEGPDVDGRLSRGSLIATIEGECFVGEVSDGPGDEEPLEGEQGAELLHEENGDYEEPDPIRFIATVDLTWNGEGTMQRSSGHFTGPGEVCKDRSAWRGATATGLITLEAEGVLSVELSPALSDWASISKSSFSCHSKGSAGPA
jgi:hypothetical protein